jgi:hypothetical protein
MQSGNNLKQIGLALHNAHDQYGAYPPLHCNLWRAFNQGPPSGDYRGPYLPYDQANAGNIKTTFFYALLPFIEQDNIDKNRKGYGSDTQLMLMGQMANDPTKLPGSTPQKVYQAPGDPSPAKEINWQWPYTASETIFKQSLASYVPNARVFGKNIFNQNSPWNLVWDNQGSGVTKATTIPDGLSNTLAVVEKTMVTGDAVIGYKDWSVYGQTTTNSQPDGVNGWAYTDSPPEAFGMFGFNCKDPTQSWDNTYGQWWQSNCRLVSGDPREYFQPPSRLLARNDQHWANIYPYSTGTTGALNMDGSVRWIRIGISVPTWSALVTPNGGEVYQDDN